MVVYFGQVSMDTSTAQYYQENAKKLAYRYCAAGEGIALYFNQSFLPHSKVLDVGCGVGRDLKALLCSGVDAYGVDSSAAMLGELKSKFPELEGRVGEDELPRLDTVLDNEYDGVLCSAVLMHLPEEYLFDAAFALRRVLKTGGTFLMSVPGPDKTVDGQTNRDPSGRLFNGVTPEKYQFIFERLGFRLLNRWENDDGLMRSHRSWHILLFRLETSHGTRSLDVIEGVLNKDKKVATYKPALFRALAELAVINYNLAEWKTGGRVLLPISAISEKWVEYYWPLFASDNFIPQIQAESQDSGKPIAFRSMMMELIHDFKNQGDLAGFISASRNGKLSKSSQKLYRKLISKLNSTIKDGPVTHSGGVRSSNAVFSYDKDEKSVVIPADMWRELSMMGPWIQDATVLRWAELTRKLSRDTIRESQVLDCLLQRPLPDRDVVDARKFYLELADARCVWSDLAVSDENLAVDHAIPYALWRNNNLWNLLPTDAKVNGRKSDKLPTHDLISHRKESIIHNWEMMYERYPVRFENEAIYFAGRDLSFERGNWKNRLFSSFSESVEVTAMQRGIERWQPPLPAKTNVDSVKKSEQFLAEVSPKSYEVDVEKLKRPEKESLPVESELSIFSYDEVRRGGLESVVLPLVGSIAAGGPFSGFDIENIQVAPDEIDWVEVPQRYRGKKMFVIRVAGDSMEPTIQVGDYLVCEYHRHRQPGKSIVIMADFSCLDSGEEAIKRISEDENDWIFSSDNPQYDDIRVSKNDAGGEFPILGTVLYNLSKRQEL